MILTSLVLRDPLLRFLECVTVLACKKRESATRSFKFLVGPEILADPVGKRDRDFRPPLSVFYISQSCRE
jgi:hypothetical protein